MSSYRESENYCITTFQNNGPYWHLYTCGKETPVIFATDEDYTFAMNLLCQSVLETENICILAFAIMSNHIHMLVGGNKTDVHSLFSFFRKRLARYTSSRKKIDLPETFSISLKPVESLQSVRNVIVYINRNGYVADSSHTPFSYPWSTGRYYFNYLPKGQRSRDVFTDERRKMFHGRAPKLPDNFIITDGYVAPDSYCNLQSGMAMFRNAHQYFMMLSKNIEAYCNLALDIDDREFLTDAELYESVLKIVKSDYNTSNLREISKAQKFEIARHLHFDYRSSNGQICRVLNLSSYDVDTLFPFTAKK